MTARDGALNPRRLDLTAFGPVGVFPFRSRTCRLCSISPIDLLTFSPCRTGGVRKLYPGPAGLDETATGRHRQAPAGMALFDNDIIELRPAGTGRRTGRLTARMTGRRPAGRPAENSDFCRCLEVVRGLYRGLRGRHSERLTLIDLSLIIPFRARRWGSGGHGRRTALAAGRQIEQPDDRSRRQTTTNARHPGRSQYEPPRAPPVQAKVW